MKFAVTGDVHLFRYNQDKIVQESGLPERLDSIKNCLYEMGSYCNRNGIKDIFMAGDLSHGKSVIYSVAQDIMLQYFNDFRMINFHVIDGNHDLSGKGEDVVSALRPLEYVNNVIWTPFNEIRRMGMPEDILFVPYSTNLPKIIKEHKARILISHFGLSEGVLNSGLSIISEVSLKDLINRYELVILGHYHKPQEIINNKIKLYYTGSPIQLDWGERNDVKRFLVVDTDTLEVESVPFTKYKKFVQIEVTSENQIEAFDRAKAAKENGDHVKIVLKENVDTSEIKNDFQIVDKTEKDITNRGIDSSMSFHEKMRNYLKIKEIPEELHEKYLKVGVELVQKGDLS